MVQYMKVLLVKLLLGIDLLAASSLWKGLASSLSEEYDAKLV